MCPWHHKHHVPLEHQKSCAPDTAKNVLTYAHHVSKAHNADLQAISGGVRSHLSIQSFLGWDVSFLIHSRCLYLGGTSQLTSTAPNLVPLLATRCLYLGA